MKTDIPLNPEEFMDWMTKKAAVYEEAKMPNGWPYLLIGALAFSCAVIVFYQLAVL